MSGFVSRRVYLDGISGLSNEVPGFSPKLTSSFRRNLILLNEDTKGVQLPSQLQAHLSLAMRFRWLLCRQISLGIVSIIAQHSCTLGSQLYRHVYQWRLERDTRRRGAGWGSSRPASLVSGAWMHPIHIAVAANEHT